MAISLNDVGSTVPSVVSDPDESFVDTRVSYENPTNVPATMNLSQTNGDDLTHFAPRMVCGWCASSLDGVCRDKNSVCKYVYTNGSNAAALYVACGCRCNDENHDGRVDVPGVKWADVRKEDTQNPARSRRGAR